MTITVGDIYSAFPTFSPEAMIKLCNGNKELNGRTVVPLANIAAFGNQELSIFAAEREGKNFTNLVSKEERPKLNKAAGIQDEQVSNQDNKTKSAQQAIPMDTSIFDVAANKKKVQPKIFKNTKIPLIKRDFCAEFFKKTYTA